MNDNKAKPSRAELVAMLQTKGWDLVTNNTTVPNKDRTLEETARLSHAQYKKGEAVGLIAKMEAALELDLIQIQIIWEHLGLPM